MAATGTATAKFDDNRHWHITLTGVLASSTSQIFTGKAFPYSSFVSAGTLGSATLQWQGSNDGGVTWVNTGSVISSNPWAGTITPGGMSFDKYQLVVGGGDGTTSINVSISFSPQT